MKPKLLYQQVNFYWLWLGQTLILCAVQFWVVALTWFVIEETGSGVAIGTVLMAAAIPRAIFTLIAGLVIDQFAANRVATMAALGVTLIVEITSIFLFLNSFNWSYLIIVFALFGTFEALIYPALLTMLPRLVDKSQLATANAFLGGGEQITNVIGPALSGLFVGSLGLPVALLLNTSLFAIGSLFLQLIEPPAEMNITMKNPFNDTRQQLIEGWKYAWNHQVIRICLFVAAMLNFAMLGPIVVGGAKLVESRFGGDAIAYGNFLAAYGIGALAGVVVAAIIGRVKRIGLMLVWLSWLLGVGMIMLAFINTFWLSYLILACMGFAGGIVSVLAITWLQEKTEISMQGRVMSLLTFAAIALDPFSQALSGFVLEINLPTLFVSAGIIMLLTGSITYTSPVVYLHNQ